MKLEVRVITNAKRREAIFDGTLLRVKLRALPLEGKANDELIEYLAEILGLKKKDIKILKGETERRKLISLPIDEEAIRRLIFKDKGQAKEAL